MNMGVHKSGTCYNFPDFRTLLLPEKSKARTNYHGKSETVVQPEKAEMSCFFMCTEHLMDVKKSFYICT